LLYTSRRFQNGYILPHASLDCKLLVFATALGLILVFPVGILGAVSNHYVGLGVLTEMIGGFVVQGNPVAVNMFNAFGSLIMGEILFFSYGLKLGHYMKIPPRVMFRAQMVPTLVATIIVIFR
jgi:hypothetical protein